MDTNQSKRDTGRAPDPNEAQPTVDPGDNYLLVIGIDHYQNGIRPLDNAVRDAEEFRDTLQQRYGFSGDRTIELFNKDATKQAILDAFDELLTEMKEGDNLVFYFSGHGEFHELNQTGYWVPADAVLRKRGTYLSNDEVLKLIRHLKARHVFGVVDSCFSGSLFMRDLGNEYVQRQYNVPSRWLMTAGRNELVSDGVPGHNSPFARSLLAQLKANNTPYLGVQELWIRMREGVTANAKQTPRCEPLQDAGHLGGEFFFLNPDIKPADLSNIIKRADPVPIPGQGEPAAPKDADPVPPADIHSVADLKRETQKLIRKNQLGHVFELLYDQLRDDSRHLNLLYIRESNFNQIQQDIAAGIRTQEQASTSLAQIRQAILYVLDQLEEEDLKG